MTALQTNLEAYARYAAAHQITGAAEPGTLTATNWTSLKFSEPPSASAETLGSGIFVFDSSLISQTELARAAHLDVEVLATWATDLLQPYDPPSSRPFQIIDERRDEEQKVSELVTFIRRSINLPFARRVANRLDQLIRISEEEAPNQSAISSDSLRTFVRLLRNSPDLSEPGVVLTPSGNIRAEWRAAQNKLCAAEFLPDGKVHFVVFAPDIHDAQETIRLSGIALVESFLSAVEPYGADAWLKR